MLDLIVSQGRIADRSARTIEGAALTMRELERRYGLKARSIGSAAPPADDDWRVSLVQARETLIGLGEAITASIDSGYLPVMVANTCSASLATLPIVARRHPDAIVLWIDAHGDFNTPETTESGYLGGMVVAAACGLWDSGHGAGLQPRQVILIGARDVDPAERDLLDNAGVRIIPPAQVTPETVSSAVNGANIWIHIDWDVVEPGFVPADYGVPGGVLPAQLREIFQAIPSAQIVGVEMAEFHPTNDDDASQAGLAAILDIIAPLLDRMSCSHEEP
jgi:arginase/N-omega-hydroxy-L-arginine amidinohydrolase